MCISKIKAIFKKSAAIVLPHPEEPENPNQTMENTSIDDMIGKWLASYFVPAEHWDHWRNQIVIRLNPDLSANGIPVPAATWSDENGIRHMDVRPSWLNAGVIAHEQAHNSYALLTDQQKADFVVTYKPLITSDSYIKLMHSKKPYASSRPTEEECMIEGHAEVYRYVCEKMPGQLRKYYPKLF